MDVSKFNLWRATFSFCFIDGFLSPEENRYIEEKLKVLPLGPDQRSTLLSDLKSPPAVESLLPLITKPADRGFLINNIRLLAKVDQLSDREKATIDDLVKKVMAKVDLNEVGADLKSDSAKIERSSYAKDLVEKLLKI